MAVTLAIEAGASRKSVIAITSVDGTRAKPISVTPSLPTITINGSPATISPAAPLWSAAYSHVTYFLNDTIPDGADVRFTSPAGQTIVGGEVLTYMDEDTQSGWRGKHRHIYIGSPAAPGYGMCWTFTVPAPGQYKVSATWPTWGDASTATPIKIYDNTTLLGTWTVNQRVAPNDLNENGAWWEHVQTVTLASTTLKIEIVGDVTNARIIADGVRVERIGGATYHAYGDDVAGSGAAYEVAAGDVPVATNAVVDVSRLGTSNALLSPPVGRTLQVGNNITTTGAWGGPVKAYANLMRACWTGVTASGADANGYPTGGDPGVLVAQPTSNYFDGKTFPDVEPGTYTLKWDGPSVLRLTSINGSIVTLQSETLTGAADNVRVYTVAKAPGATAWGLDLSVRITSFNGGVPSNWRLYPPNVATDGSQKWHPQVLANLDKFTCLRFMSSIKINGSPIIDYADFGQSSYASYAWHAQSVRTVAITSIGGYDATDFWSNTGWKKYLVTTATAHNLREGEQIIFSHSGPIVIGHSDGSTMDLRNAKLMAHVVSSTTFAVAMRATAHVSVNAPFTDPGATVDVDRIPGIPPLDCVELCNATGADLWMCVPHLATDACVTALFAMVAANLASGRKCYVEYSNECWNDLQDFSQYWWCAGKSNALGLTSGADDVQTQTLRYQCRRSAEVHTLARAAFVAAGRPATDAVRVLSTQLGLSSRTAAMATYSAAQGYQFDLLAGAPYPSNGPRGVGGYDYEDLTADQVADVFEAAILSDHDGYLATWAEHRAALDAAGYTSVGLCAYEGQAEFGGLSAVTATQAKQSIAVAFHPRMANLDWSYLKTSQDAGLTLHCVFGDFNSPSAFGGHEASLWWHYLGTLMRAGRGDGTDGLTDNRTLIGGAPPAYPDLEQAVAVRGYAADAWNTPDSSPATVGRPPRRGRAAAAFGTGGV